MIDWDEWRSRYSSMTYAEQQAFYSEVWKHHPSQLHFDAGAALAFMRALPVMPRPMRVVEIGGWRGELAEALIPYLPASWSWLNLEICREAAAASVCQQPAFRAVSPESWPWEDLPTLAGADILVASHVIEHMSVEHLEALVDSLATARWMFLASPLPQSGTPDWAGYNGSHVLPLSLDGVTDLLADRGWDPFASAGTDSRTFVRKG